LAKIKKNKTASFFNKIETIPNKNHRLTRSID